MQRLAAAHPAELAGVAYDLEPSTGAHADEVGLELRDYRQDVEEDFDHRLRRLVDAHALASTRGDGHNGAAMLVGAGRRRLWETLGLLEDLDPDVHVADAHELVVSLDQVEEMLATAERLPAPHQPRSAKEIRRQVRAQRALERSASASVQLRAAIDDLDADHEAMGR